MTTRRGFLGLFGAGAVSGPSLIKDNLVKATTFNKGDFFTKVASHSIVTDTSSKESSVNEMNYWKKELKCLNFSNSFAEKEKNIVRARTRRAYEIDELKSVSSSHKYIMNEKNIEKQNKNDAENSILRKIFNISQGRNAYEDL